MDSYKQMRVFFKAGIMKVFDTSTSNELFRSKASKSIKGTVSTQVADQEAVKKTQASPAFRINNALRPVETDQGKDILSRGVVPDQGGASKTSNLNIQSLSKSSIRYGLDENKNIVMQLVDPESNEVIRQIPPEDQVRIAKAIEKLLEESARKSKDSGNSEVDTVA